MFLVFLFDFRISNVMPKIAGLQLFSSANDCQSGHWMELSMQLFTCSHNLGLGSFLDAEHSERYDYGLTAPKISSKLGFDVCLLLDVFNTFILLPLFYTVSCRYSGSMSLFLFSKFKISKFCFLKNKIAMFQYSDIAKFAISLFTLFKNC